MDFTQMLEQKRCPICASGHRSRPRVSMRHDEFPEYVTVLAAGMGLSAVDFAERVKSFECNECGCVYLDPYVSLGNRNEMFLRNSPLHQTGLDRFFKSITGQSPPLDCVRVSEFVEGHLGDDLGRYLEVGCPFNGLALHWIRRDKLIEGLSECVASRELYRGRGRRISLQNRANYVQISSQYLARFILWIHLLRHKKSLCGDAPLGRRVSSQPEIFFLPEFSTSQWSYECKALGRSCVELGRSSIGYKVISTGILEDLEDDFFDLAGLFNVLDHSDRPLELIRQVSRKSKIVLISGHRMVDAHLQHRFAIQDDTIPRLAKMCGLECQEIDFPDVELKRRWFLFALSKERILG